MEEFRFGGVVRARSTAPPRWFLQRLLAIRLPALLARRELSSPRVAERANSRRQITRLAAEHHRPPARAAVCLERRGTRLPETRGQRAYARFGQRRKHQPRR